MPRSKAGRFALRFAFVAFVFLSLASGRARGQVVVKVNDDVNFRLGTLIQGNADWTQDPISEGNSQNIFLRRVRLILLATISPNVSAFYETDNARLGNAGTAGTRSLDTGFLTQDAYLEWKVAGDKAMIDAGLFYTTQSRGVLNSSSRATCPSGGPPPVRLFRQGEGVHLRGNQSGGKVDPGCRSLGRYARGLPGLWGRRVRGHPGRQERRDGRRRLPLLRWRQTVHVGRRGRRHAAPAAAGSVLHARRLLFRRDQTAAVSPLRMAGFPRGPLSDKERDGLRRGRQLVHLRSGPKGHGVLRADRPEGQGGQCQDQTHEPRRDPDAVLLLLAVRGASL